MSETRQRLNSAAIEQLINKRDGSLRSNDNANQNEAGGSASGNCQVKYATCTQLDSALTLWNSHVKTVGIDAAYAMTWKELMKMMTEDTIRMANSLMDQKVHAIATRDAESKRKWEDEHEGNHRQQQNKRQEAGRVYVFGTGNKTGYAGTSPLCDK
ncbi:hypothetical protein Tco_0389978 [Tanacetum coccineum]